MQQVAGLVERHELAAIRFGGELDVVATGRGDPARVAQLEGWAVHDRERKRVAGRARLAWREGDVDRAARLRGADVQEEVAHLARGQRPSAEVVDVGRDLLGVRGRGAVAGSPGQCREALTVDGERRAVEPPVVVLHVAALAGRQDRGRANGAQRVCGAS